MKPRLLKISGLNSFVEEQTIDFSTLIEGGLFGIFGPTGSGKSTILDAITMALYGYNAIPRGTKEFINTDRDKVYLSYEFESGDKCGRQAYRVERSIKKNKRGGIRTDFARLSFLDDEGNVEKIIDKVWEIDNAVEGIIGLTHQDFTRSVVLPQGKFSEFLKLAGSDRRNMLERILGLEKYGIALIDKIRSFKRKREEELQVLRGELNRFDGVTEENIKVLREELSQIEIRENDLKDGIRIIEERYEELNKIWGLQNELNKYLEHKKKLGDRSSEIETLRKRWERGRNGRKVKPYLDRYESTVEDINRNKLILKDISVELESVSKRLEETEEKYRIIYLKKDKELPLLIEKETNVKNAIGLKVSIDKLVKERNDLAEKFTKYNGVVEESKKELSKLKITREENYGKIKELENKAKELRVSPEYRERLARAWELEKRFNDMKREEQICLGDIENTNKNILLNEAGLNTVKKDLIEKENLYSEIKDKLEKLKANRPKDSDYILKKEIEVHKLKLIFEETRENLKKKDNLDRELKIIHDNKREAGIKLDYLKRRHNENNEKLEKVKIEIEELEKSHRAGLLSLHLKEGKPCPVCGSSDHPNIAESICEDTIEKIVKIKEGFEESKKEIERAIYQFEIEIKGEAKEEDKLKSELDILIKKLKDYDVVSLEEEIKNRGQEIDNLRTLLKDWEGNRQELKETLEIKEREKLDLEKQSIRFIEGIRKDRERLKEDNKRKQELIEKLNKTNNLYNEAKGELNIEDISNEMKIIRKKEDELLNVEEKLKALRNNINEIDIVREKIEEALNNALVERSKIEEAGKEKRGVIDEYTEKISKIIGDKEPTAFLKEIKERKTKIIHDEEVLRKLKEEEMNLLNKLQKKRVAFENTNKTLEDSLMNFEKELQEALKENKFSSLEEINTSLVSELILQSMEKEVSQFDNEIKGVESNIARIKNELKEDVLEEVDFLKCKKDVENKKESYRALLEEMGKKKERLNEMERNFEKVKEIDERVKKLQHITDMLTEMFKLVSGNKFVEYVATSHLRYISKEASKRLMNITNRRYSLELDSRGNFIICDNHNGGVRRGCNTLSGGETFLTSLALALALSSQIQLKGNASIEFFFLDEGFGTLDSHLLDTVMSSLERLNQEKLAVGIISHVAELKNRVPVKLEITPSEAGFYGTKVEIIRS